VTTARRVAVAVLLLLVGGGVGLMAVAAHGRTEGLLLAVLATVAAVYALPGGRWFTRLPFGAGWMLVVFYASRPRPEGDYLVAADARGYVLLGAGVVVLMYSLLTVRT